MNQDQSLHRRFLDKVVNSECFSSSQNLKNLMEYLTECSIQNNPPKEIQIAAEIFNKDLTDKSNQDSAIVRVNVHNLRKKLEHYYLTEGKNDEIRFVVPKGRYEVELTSVKTNEAYYKRYLTGNLLIVYILILFISVLSTLAFFKTGRLTHENLATISPVWKDLTDGNKKTMIVIGDYFFISDRDTALNRTTLVRDFSINSPQQLKDFLIRHPEYTKRYNQADFTYTGFSMPSVLKELIPLVCHNEFEVTLMSQFNAHYLQDYNIIFVGLFKTMGYIKNLQISSGFVVDDENMTISIPDSTGKNSVVLKQEGSAETLHNDYAIATKLRGSNNNSIFIMSSFHDIGIAECAKLLTKTETLEQIQDYIRSCGKSENENFEVLFKVIGLDRNDLNSEIIKINLLESASVFKSENY